MLAAGALLASTALVPARAEDKGPIKVGLLHSLFGATAISETVLKDMTLMSIEEINAGIRVERGVGVGFDHDAHYRWLRANHFGLDRATANLLSLNQSRNYSILSS